MNEVKRYLTYYTKTLKISLSYKANIVIQFIGNILSLCLLTFVWTNITGATQEETAQQLFTVLLSTEIMILNETWLEYDFESKIKNGNFIIELVKPVDIITMTFFKNLGFIMTNLIIISFPTIIIFFWGQTSDIINIDKFPFFLISLIFAISINFFISLIIGIFSISLKSVWGILIFKEVLIALFSGILIPITLYPEVIQTVLKFLPIYAIYQAPMNIILDQSETILFNFGYQLFWLIVLIFVARNQFHKKIETMSFFGG